MATTAQERPEVLHWSTWMGMAALAALVNLIVLVSPSLGSVVETVGTLPQVSDYEGVLQFIPPGLQVALPIAACVGLAIVAAAQFMRPRKRAGYDFAPKRVSLFFGFLLPGLAITVAGPGWTALALAGGVGLGIWAWTAQQAEQQRMLAQLVLEAFFWLLVAAGSYGVAFFFAFRYLMAQLAT